ncbi:hypothetical protein ACI2KR_08970 [Pseudomonas luteola]
MAMPSYKNNPEAFLIWLLEDFEDLVEDLINGVFGAERLEELETPG